MKRLSTLFTLLFPGAFAICLSAGAFAQSSEMLCEHGDGTYTGKSRTGVSVTVEADRSPELAARSCRAVLKVGASETVVASNAAQLDLDMLDATLEDGTVAAGFQVRQSDKDCCVSYRLYALQSNPRLLYAIQGGSVFVAQDVDLNDEIEFWTNDASVVQGFEGMTLSEFDFLPTFVLRFYGGSMHDTSGEFEGFYDKKVHQIKAALTPDAARAFRESDGRLHVAPNMSVAELERLRTLRQTKIKVLEIVWAYLYSGREKQALSALAEYWPAADRDRIWAAILDARRRGLRAQLPAGSGAPARIATFPDPSTITYVADPKNEASTILARIHQPIAGTFKLDLIIDAAGKVRDVRSRRKLPVEIIAAAMTWKFIPAWRTNRSVASFRTRTFFLKQ